MFPCLILRFASLVVQSLYALVANSRMHRLRLSSEGPEVVSQIPDKFFVPYTNRSPRSALYQKQLDAKGETSLFPLPLIREPSRFEEEEQDRYCGARSCSLVTVLLVIGAFLLGGGIGGGIGGAFIVKDKAKISRWVVRVVTISSTTFNLFCCYSLTSKLAVLPTATVTLAAPSTPTACFLDQAGCPNINNTTYTSTTPGYTFLQICEMSIVSKTAESIDISSKVQTSWKACMDSCASYNKNVKQGGCQGATWQIFSTTNPSNNSVCTLKSSAELTAAQPSGDQLCSGVLLS